MDSQQGAETLLNIFQSVLSGTDAVRRQAEAQLFELRTEPGFSVALCMLLASVEVPVHFRQFAGVILRQYVSKMWATGTPQYEGPGETSPNDKATVRQQITNCLGDSSKSVRTAAATVVGAIACVDWPEEWPGLFEGLIDMIKTHNPDYVHGAMRAFAEFATHLAPEHMPTVIPVLLPELLVIYQNEGGYFSRRDQARAVAVLNNCVKALEMTLETDEEAAISMLSGMLPQWLQAFHALVFNEPDQLGADCGVKIEVMKVLLRLVRDYSRYLGDSLDQLLPAVWQALLDGTALYAQVTTEGNVRPDQDSDGDVLGFDHLLSMYFEFFTQLSKRKKFRKMLRQSLDQLAIALIAYMQMTNDQIDIWASDPEQYVQEEEEDIVKGHSVRVCADDLLFSLIDEEMVGGINFVNAVATAVAGAVVHALGQSGERKAAGDPNWWRLREAAYMALGRVGDNITEMLRQGDIEFDVQGFMGNVLLPDLQEGGGSEYLYGRALWLASNFTDLVPGELASPFLEAVVGGLSSDHLSIRILSCKAVLNMGASDNMTQIVTPFVPQIIEGSINVAQQFPSEQCLLIVMQGLNTIANVNKEVTVTLENVISPFVIAIWLKYPTSHAISAEVYDMIDRLAAIPAYYPMLLQRMGPTLLSILNNPQSHNAVPGFVSAAVDLLGALLKFAPDPVPDVFLTDIFPAVSNQMLSTDDHSLMQSGTEVLVTFVRRCADRLVESIDGQPAGMHQVVQIIARLLQPEQASEDAAAFVGRLIVGIVKQVGDRLGDMLGDMLRAVIERLAVAQVSYFAQALILVFAQLINIQGVEPVLNFLTNNEINGYSALIILVQQWMKFEPDFNGDYGIKVSIVALSKLIFPLSDAIAQIPVRGWLIDRDEGIVTRGRKKQTGANIEEFSETQFPIKVLSLFMNHVRDAEEQGGVEMSNEGDSEDEEAPAPAPRRDGRSPYMNLDEVIQMGLYEEDSDEGVDAEALDDPVNEINVFTFLVGFCQQFNRSSPDLFVSVANHLNGLDQETLQRVLAYQNVE